MKENENSIGYYSLIPATVLYNKELKANEKLLYAIINSLANKDGYRSSLLIIIPYFLTWQL